MGKSINQSLLSRKDTPYLAELWGACCENFGETDRVITASLQYKPSDHAVNICLYNNRVIVFVYVLKNW